MVAIPLLPFGERNGNAKLNDEAVREIRRMRERGVAYAKIARLFKVNYQTVKHVAEGRTWRHVK